ncbi:replication initiator protein [Sigmofec virus UA08Rod_6800]|uniref:Replication initiator protein n=1 Tax=Sigmofec virus UA08Rod_6800 TaxID=2929240 RepID=A0A976N0L6_9VIRU|nr:replication initiator protein [Sigmofec virus UA08Rod_6800]
MRCLSPILIKNARGEIMRVSCKQCISCRLNRSQEWTIRLMDELKDRDYAVFLTLTYDDEHLPRVSDEYATLDYKDVQLYWKRVRKALGKDYRIRYYVCGEYGTKFGRPHYHAIVYCDFNNCVSGMRLQFERRLQEVLRMFWSYGFVYFGDVNPRSCAYVARYCVKLLTGKASKYYSERNIRPEFARQSRRPGIAGEHVHKFAEEYRRFKCKRWKGKDVALPRFYKDKTYEEMDRIFERASLAVADALKIKKFQQRIKDVGIAQASKEDYESEIQEELNLLSRFSLGKRNKIK